MSAVDVRATPREEVATDATNHLDWQFGGSPRLQDFTSLVPSFSSKRTNMAVGGPALAPDTQTPVLYGCHPEC